MILATRCFNACKELGAPLCHTALAQCATYLALTRKSNELYLAYNSVAKVIQEGGCLPVPVLEAELEGNQSLLPTDLKDHVFLDVERAIGDLREISIKRMLDGKEEGGKEKDANLIELPLEKRIKLYLNEESKMDSSL